MSIGIGNATMINLNWRDIQRNVQNNAIALLPLGVIEEHGPHLCLGTDIYTAELYCRRIAELLDAAGMKAVIAPPNYWGVCQSTGGYIGSFRIRRETAKSLLIDIIASLAEFGFKNVYGVNAHGDIDHNVVIVEAFREAAESLGINAGYAFRKEILHHYGMSGTEAYICPIETQLIEVSKSQYPDVHGGDIETATMKKYFPEFTDDKLADTLPPISLAEDQIMKWLLGGCTKQLSENGYLGSPSEYANVDVERNISDIAARITDSIIIHMKRNGIKTS
ncbi:MAG: creatininase family protein [Anaerolineales bacterium]|nr:creatininase family protein [Anaerolineales bacterium]